MRIRRATDRWKTLWILRLFRWQWRASEHQQFEERMRIWRSALQEKAQVSNSTAQIPSRSGFEREIRVLEKRAAMEFPEQGRPRGAGGFVERAARWCLMWPGTGRRRRRIVVLSMDPSPQLRGGAKRRAGAGSRQSFWYSTKV